MRKSFFVAICLFCGVGSWIFLQGQNDQTPLSKITVDLNFRALHPGEVVKVSVKTSAPVKNIQARFSGEKYLLGAGPNPGEYLGLIGIDLGLEPGFYPIVVTPVFADGSHERVVREIFIVAKEFPVKKLWVDEKYVTPPPEVLDRIREESQLLSEIYGIYSPQWLGKGPFIIPSEGEVAPNFGERRFFNDKPRSPHSGVDISSPYGAPVAASNSGKVVLVSNLYYAGNTVIIDHGLGVFTLYIHLSKFRVKRGDVVEKGAIIGEVGATGRVTGPHLHWGAKIQGNRVDPFSLLYLDFSQ
jgi:murein DD-endopeptidase MepM/ murein hydrolase activator NlpD